MATAGTRASAGICEALRPEYEDVVNNLASALLPAADTSELEREFRQRLVDGGVTFTAHLRPMPFRPLADVTSPQGMLCAWFKDAVEQGVIELERIPEPWRDRWFGTHAVWKILSLAQDQG